MGPEEIRIWWAVHTNGKTPQEINELWGLLGEDERHHVWESVTPQTRQIIQDSNALVSSYDHEPRIARTQLAGTQQERYGRKSSTSRGLFALFMVGGVIWIVLVIIILIVALFIILL